MKFAPLAGSVPLLALTSPKHAGPVEAKKKKRSIHLPAAGFALEGCAGILRRHSQPGVIHFSLPALSQLSSRSVSHLKSAASSTQRSDGRASRFSCKTIVYRGFDSLLQFFLLRKRGGVRAFFVVRGLRKRIKLPQKSPFVVKCCS